MIHADNYKKKICGISNYYGHTFSDGEAMDKRKSFGGLTTTHVQAWDKTSSTSKSSTTTKIMKRPTINHLNNPSGILSTQKRGASKIVIPGDVSKPIFLKKLLSFIREELRVLDATDDEPGTPRRLQVYTEAFDLYIREFRSYEPVLSDIKREYDLIIENQCHHLSQYEIVKSKLSVMEFRIQKEIDKVKIEAQMIIKELNDEKRELEAQYEKEKKERVVLTEQILKLNETIKMQKEKKSTESPEMVELKNHMNDMLLQEKKMRDLMDAKTAQVVDLLATKQKLTHELLESTNTISKLKNSLVGITVESHQKLQQELVIANETIGHLKDEQNQMKLQLQVNNRTSKAIKFSQKGSQSSYPNWEHIQSLVPFNVREYFNLAKEMTNDDTIAILIRELNKAKSQEIHSAHPTNATQMVLPDQFFIGKGLDPNVPKYLRTKGKILNRRLNKNQCVMLIKDIWEAKLIYDSESKSKKISLSQFFYLYLKKRFGNQETICEWGYNITEACLKYRDHNADCNVFLGILNSDMDETVYHELSNSIQILRKELYRTDMRVHQLVERGFLEREEILQTLNTLYPYKSKLQMAALQEELFNDQASATVIYKTLFESESDSRFLNCVKQQEMDERLSYYNLMDEGLKRMSRDDTMSVFEAIRMIGSIDSTKPADDIDELVAAGFGIKSSSLKPKLTIEKSLFLKVFKNFVLMCRISSHYL
ncbi:hypothetical protein BC833DRAFT_606862 [Globomyces pollinis-pini]|nr:hypothetical protein BC833DRAFT_606862 [Globomyces pollinis-pini]